MDFLHPLKQISENSYKYVYVYIDTALSVRNREAYVNLFLYRSIGRLNTSEQCTPVFFAKQPLLIVSDSDVVDLYE